MKTLQELYTEIMNSNALKTEFLTLTTPEEIVAFAEKNGCTATLQEIKAFFEEQAAATGELTDAELAQVAGGKSVMWQEALISVLSVGTYCAGFAIASATGSKGRKCGTGIKGEGVLCGY